MKDFIIKRFFQRFCWIHSIQKSDLMQTFLTSLGITFNWTVRSVSTFQFKSKQRSVLKIWGLLLADGNHPCFVSLSDMVLSLARSAAFNCIDVLVKQFSNKCKYF